MERNMPVKKTANLTDNNWMRLKRLLENKCYDNMTDGLNDLVRRALPIVEGEMGIITEVTV